MSDSNKGGGDAVAWARQCDLDESDPAIFVAREEVQESGYVVPLFTRPPVVAEAEPVAMKSHGAWDGLDDLAWLPDGTRLYAHPPASGAVPVPETWQERLERMHPTVEAGKWPKRWVDEAKDDELRELRELLAKGVES